MTTTETCPRDPRGALFDLESQTPAITGTDLPTRVVAVDAIGTRPFLPAMFASDTAPDLDIWRQAAHEPLGLGPIRRRDHSFAWRAIMIAVPAFFEGTPAVETGDPDLALFETVNDLAFRTVASQWHSLVAVSFDEPLEQEIDENPSRDPLAWTAFEELGTFLQLSHAETSRLLGLGEKTAYGWRREGREPQPRLARRLYQTHAFVSKLADALGLPAARAALSQGGESSALALIEDNRVADAEARFAHLLFHRPTDQPPITASMADDRDLPAAASAPRRLPGGRRRVQPKRGR